MGQTQSTRGRARKEGCAQEEGEEEEEEEEEARKDYYELLELGPTATEEEIKKAYRRKALELHPDRNYGNVGVATKLFAEVQSAYEVLSDPQERAWYDSHRDAILHHVVGKSEAHFERNVRITTAEDITRMYMRFDGHFEYNDSPSGFYTTLRDLFAGLAGEEEMACQWAGLSAPDYPSFGCGEDSYEDVVKPFYAIWIGFSTQKSFSWKDVYRYSEAPDRRVRRMMEKDNKRLRDEGIREFNDAVRVLVAYVKKRDPRYKPNTQTEAERQKLLREQSALQATKARAANQAKTDQHTVQEWTKSQSVDDNDQIGDFEEEDEGPEEHFECLVCKKTFKSENQFDAHEKSRKHTQAVRQIQKKMRKDDARLGLNTNVYVPSATTASTSGDETRSQGSFDGGTLDEASPTDTLLAPITLKEIPLEHETCSVPDNGDVLGEQVFTHILHHEEDKEPDGSGHETPSSTDPLDQLADDLSFEHIDDSGTAQSKLKTGKAKEKRARRAARQGTTNGSQAEFRCAACQAGFPSKTRLFNHINDLGHAQPLPQPENRGRGQKGTKGKKM